MGIFDDIYRNQRERCNGRIDPTPGNWVFDPGGAESRHKRKDANGREMFLISQKAVSCDNPDVGFEFPKSNDWEYWCVPYKVCRKCQHYRKGGTDHLRYPHCQWTRERLGGSAGAAQSVVDIMAKAVETANEIIGG